MCPSDKDIIVFKSSGYKLRETSPATHDKNSTIAALIAQPLQQISSETECIFSCLINLVTALINDCYLVDLRSVNVNCG